MNHICNEKPEYIHIYQNTNRDWIIVNDKNGFKQDLMVFLYCPFCGLHLMKEEKPTEVSL